MSTISITMAQLYTTIGNFVQTAIGVDPATSAPVVVTRGQINRVPMPDTAFINMQLFTAGQLGTNVHTYDNVEQTVAIESGTKVKLRLDFYGPLSEDWARIMGILWRDPVGCNALADIGAPLYYDPALQAAMVNGEEEYEDRWIMDLFFQYNPVVTQPQQSATSLKLKLYNVDVQYPPAT